MKLFNSAVILAGGKSERMGFDKQTIRVHGRRLMDKIILTLKKEFDEIILISNKPVLYTDSGCLLISDEIKGMGPLGGIHAGLKKASSRYVYFTACDMPNLNLDYIRFMKSRIKETDAEACVTKIGDWIEPFNAFYSKGILDAVESDLLNLKGSIFHLLKKSECCFIEEKEARKFSPDWSMFLNLNTRQELEDYIDSLNL
ncbi:MAG: molybdenum cofactor guanylyltransferase [Clostridiales bacterium]|jgi:molybdopterin-guanine dinucleotide biosynthesis protein A|nr:molybdenum cofactor guanylyltransferase [Eubacteriales bacterium]MDH7566479.1 molybdenum cofactor guanylyltransferase [Clostridiales bacterium]